MESSFELSQSPTWKQHNLIAAKGSPHPPASAAAAAVVVATAGSGGSCSGRGSSRSGGGGAAAPLMRTESGIAGNRSSSRGNSSRSTRKACIVLLSLCCIAAFEQVANRRLLFRQVLVLEPEAAASEAAVTAADQEQPAGEAAGGGGAGAGAGAPQSNSDTAGNDSSASTTAAPESEEMEELEDSNVEEKSDEGDRAVSSSPRKDIPQMPSDIESLGVRPRAFGRWGMRRDGDDGGDQGPSPPPLPCPPLEGTGEYWNKGLVQRSPAKKGFLFVKVPKTGSTTAAGVTLRIASRVAERWQKQQQQQHQNVTAAADSSAAASWAPPVICRNRIQHAVVQDMRYDRRDRAQSVLWSLIRDPTTRMVSHYYHFHVSRRNKDPADYGEFERFFASRIGYLTNFQLKYLSLWPFDEDVMTAVGGTGGGEGTASSSSSSYTDPEYFVNLINKILQEYDFIGVMERTDESVVALQMILGLETEDVLYVTAKSSGGYDDGRYENRCVLIQPSDALTPEMRHFFDGSPTWKRMSYWDAVLHRAVNRSLDMTIDGLGRSDFERNLAKFRRARSLVERECMPTLRMPCTKNGKRRKETDCIYDDMGCGFECMDSVMTNNLTDTSTTAESS